MIGPFLCNVDRNRKIKYCEYGTDRIYSDERKKLMKNTSYIDNFFAELLSKKVKILKRRRNSETFDHHCLNLDWQYIKTKTKISKEKEYGPTYLFIFLNKRTRRGNR